MNKLIFAAPINNLSFGNVSYNLLRELYKKKDLEVVISPPIPGSAETPDLSAFQPDKEFLTWVRDCYANRLERIKRDIPTLKLWHINGAENRFSNNQRLFTFHELDETTETERNIVNMQDKTFFSSSFSESVFGDCNNVGSTPLGFDLDMISTSSLKPVDRINFCLIGKLEKRKHTEKIIKLWVKKYGNNANYQLNLLITNNFIKPEIFNQILNRVFDGKRPFNINFLPFLKTNKEMAVFMNDMHVDLSGLSGAEGWGLPSFNMTALGKWSIVLNATAHKDWATDKNCILVSKVGEEPAYDGVFFTKGSPFNQGNISTWDEEEVSAAMDLAANKAGIRNIEGLELQDKFTYEKTLNTLLEGIF